MCDVENVSQVKLMLFCCKIGFVANYAVLSRFTLFCREICFVMIRALLCGEKLNQKLHMWRKMTNMRYDLPPCLPHVQVGSE